MPIVIIFAGAVFLLAILGMIPLFILIVCLKPIRPDISAAISDSLERDGCLALISGVFSLPIYFLLLILLAGPSHSYSDYKNEITNRTIAPKTEQLNDYFISPNRPSRVRSPQKGEINALAEASCIRLKETVFMRTQENGPITKKLKSGLTIHLLKRGPEWCKVRFAEKTGFVPSKNLESATATECIEYEVVMEGVNEVDYVYLIKNRNTYHNSECPFLVRVVAKDLFELTRVDANAQHLTECQTCKHRK